MMARAIAIANPKGGVGKTTTVTNLGVALAEMQKETLLVDMDPQATLSAGLGLDGNALEETIYTALVGTEFSIDRIVHPIREHLHLIPANIDLASADMDLIAEIRREFLLSHLLEPLQSRYDFILVDCPPNLGLLPVNALCASQEVLIPLQCEYFAMRSVRPLLDAMEKIKARLNHDLKLTGILATLYSTRTIHAREVLAEIRSVFGDQVFDVVIYKSIRFAEASAANRAIVDYASQHKGAQAYRELAREIVGSEAGDPSHLFRGSSEALDGHEGDLLGEVWAPDTPSDRF
jgi:chromosome partitioning protein